MDPLLGYKPDVSLIPAASGPILAMKGGGTTEDMAAVAAAFHTKIINFLRDPSNVFIITNADTFAYDNTFHGYDTNKNEAFRNRFDNYTVVSYDTPTTSTQTTSDGTELVRVQYDLIVTDKQTAPIAALDAATTNAVIEAAKAAAVEAVKVHLASAPPAPTTPIRSSSASSSPAPAPAPAPAPTAPISSSSSASSTSSTPAPIRNETSQFNGVKPGKPYPNIQASLYYPEFFQPQETALGCGRFALNNLFHNERFVFDPSKGFQSSTDSGLTRDAFSEKYSQEFSKMATRDQINLSEVCHIVSRFLLISGLFTVDNSCRDDEYFSMDVLQSALQIIGHETNEVQILDKTTNKPIDMATFKNYINHDLYVRDDATNTYTLSSDNQHLLGYIINYGKSHYVALRKLPASNMFEYIDSIVSDKSDFSTTRDFLKYVTTNNRRIVSIRQVLNVTKSINPFETLQADYDKEKAEDTEQDRLKREIIKRFAANYKTFIINHPDYAEDIATFLTTFQDYQTEGPTLLSILDTEDLVNSNTTKLETYMNDKKEYIQSIKAAKDEYLKEQRTKGSSKINVAPLPQARDMIELFNKTDGGKRKLRRRRVTKKK
jgi:hypothetical protein